MTNTPAQPEQSAVQHRARNDISAPADLFRELSKDFYTAHTQSMVNLNTKANQAEGNLVKPIGETEKAIVKSNQQAFDSAIDDIMNSDLRACRKLEGEPFYTSALYPKPEEKITLDEHQRRMDVVLSRYDALHRRAQAQLLDKQRAELAAFNNQLDSYIAQAKAAGMTSDQQLAKLSEYAQERHSAFQAYQQSQLDKLQSVYKQRQENFLSRIANAPQDIQFLRARGFTGSELERAFTTPSEAGDGVNKLLKERQNRQYEYFSIPVDTLLTDSTDASLSARLKIVELYKRTQEPSKWPLGDYWRQRKFKSAQADFKKEFGYQPYAPGEKAENRVNFSVSVEEKNGESIATVHFDTPADQIPYSARLGGWCAALDKVTGNKVIELTRLQMSVALPSAKELAEAKKLANKGKSIDHIPSVALLKDEFGKPVKGKDGKFVIIEQRYALALGAGRHAIGQNKDAKVDFGWLPPGTEIEKISKRMISTAAREQIHAQAREGAGLSAQQPGANRRAFAAPRVGAGADLIPAQVPEGVLDQDRGRQAANMFERARPNDQLQQNAGNRNPADNQQNDQAQNNPPLVPPV